MAFANEILQLGFNEGNISTELQNWPLHFDTTFQLQKYWIMSKWNQTSAESNNVLNALRRIINSSNSKYLKNITFC